MLNCKKIKEDLSYTFEEEGFYWAWKKAKTLLKERVSGRFEGHAARKTEAWKNEERDGLYDVIIINGCDYSVPHPIRYRVGHQLEQLAAAGFAAKMVNAWDLNDNYLRRARLFIIFRCPWTEYIGEFIAKAKSLNKKVLYDIDDLVISTEYTDTIPFVRSMGAQDKAGYDDCVVRMGRTLSLCDAAITTTEVLAGELQKFVPKVYINRNVASDSMLALSEEALYRRDVLPEIEDKALRKHYSGIKKYWKKRKESDSIVIGYFSGSITHNADFEIVLPALVSVMEEYENVRLLIGGELTLPEELLKFGDRVDTFSFCGWQRLTFHIAKCDINIAPLADSLFNRAKSENKWVEAALLKIPTIASNVGAFADSIEDRKTGILCKNDTQSWKNALVELISSSERREELGCAAYRYCRENRISVYSSSNIKEIIEENLSPNIAFIMPSMNISGGVLVALKHGCILQNRGYDVSFLGSDNNDLWVDYDGHSFPVLNRHVLHGEMDNCPIHARLDAAVATFWDTFEFVARYPRLRKKYYLVQNYETDFFPAGSPVRFRAESTYQSAADVGFLTISKWCKSWLISKYGHDCKFARNGIDAKRFYPAERDWTGKIRILIEGDCGCEYKNVDEAFRITNSLDPAHYEIWYMCYTGKTKDWYKIDKNLGRVPQEKTGDVYRQCHILLKTSILESFSYPPLEMMATGGCVVVCPNEGNVEYLVDGHNCLMYEQGNCEEAQSQINRLRSDRELCSALARGGIDTAQSRDWSALEDEIAALYA